MFSFTMDQKVFEVADTKIGGQPGVYPTVVFAGLFFKGKVDLKWAEEQLREMYRVSEETSVPAIPDFFLRRKEDVPSILDFIASRVPEDKPFSLDIIEADVKQLALKEAEERGLLDRMIYNSIHIGITEEEEEALSKYTPRMIIIVTFNPRDSSPDGRVEVLETGANLIDKGLLRVAEDIGVDEILVDTAAMAPGENSGSAIAAIPVIKEEYGYPTGCAVHNVVEKSSWLKKYGDTRRTVDVSSNISIPLFGGDFLLFGPIELSNLVIPVVAWVDILVSEYTERYFGVKPVESHPRRRLLD